MIRYKKYNLLQIIYNDLYIYGRIQLFLLLLIIISAIAVIVVTHKTRCMIIDREKFLLEKESLKKERNNLVLKKEILSSHIRIERIAIDKFKMDYVNTTLDNILNN